MSKNIKVTKNICPECGGKVNEQTQMYIDECDRCLAKTID